MKPEMIIKLLEECNEFIEEKPTEYGLELTVSDVKIVAEALEKQVAKKAKGISDTWECKVANCPTCHKFIDNKSSWNGCEHCLQKLDWSEEEWLEESEQVE